ncbi:uncharacterized protein LOC116840390 isoform X2 [Odontomachus brunneus]|uniref:uncharacterized protein LOC116840390 isoform X2 n=1 Tax=Odontomachus brunneus TaxID=486640 RepID=UPI0013F253FA|nr:uncharacterized protein LOC116840390 isoform X2 [Odontomachus brunneus]
MKRERPCCLISAEERFQAALRNKVEFEGDKSRSVMIHGILVDISDDEICSILCKECDASAVLVNNQCECNFNDDNEECIQRLQREIQTIDLNALSDDFTNEERSSRAAFKPRRRLRIGDARKVVEYFTNGGVSAGHSHFLRGSDAICDNTNSATNSVSGTIRQSNTEDELYLPTSALSGNIYKSHNFPLHILPGAVATILDPGISSTKTYAPILGIVRPTFDYLANRLYPTDPVLDSNVHLLRNRGHKSPSHVLLQTLALPLHTVHNLAARRYFPYYPPMYHNPIGKNSYPRQENSPITPLVGQPYGNNNDFDHETSNDSSITRNNADESVQGNVASTRAARMNALFPLMQYRHLFSPLEYIPYYSPLLYSPFDEYVAPAASHNFQRISDSTLTSTQNSNSYYINNANTERRDEVLTTVTDETAYSNDEQAKKTDDATDHTSVSKEQKEM